MSELNNIFSSENTHRELASPVNSEEFCKVVRSRRSVRRFSQKKIPEPVMRECLELALLAPNSSNLQPWEFYWVRDPETRKKINPAFLNQPAVTTAAEVVVAVARTATWKNNSKKMIQMLEKSQAIGAIKYYKKIVPLAYSIGCFGILGFFKKIFLYSMGLFQPMPREVTSRAELQIWAVKTTALACENLMLSLRAFGFDSCPMEGMDSRRLKKILNLPKDAVVVMGISAGERAEDGVYGPQVRFPSNEFIREV